MPGTNARAYYEKVSLMSVKRFTTLATGLFRFVSMTKDVNSKVFNFKLGRFAFKAYDRFAFHVWTHLELKFGLTLRPGANVIKLLSQ